MSPLRMQREGFHPPAQGGGEELQRVGRGVVVAKNAPRKDMHNGFDAGLSSYHSFLIR
jgi:hypothetical protein